MLKKIILFFACLPIFIQSKFLLILGPSGAGKSTIINNLKQLDDRFEYISPFTTRQLRNGEKDKIHMNLEEINNLNSSGKLLTINNIYGIYYATPKYIIDELLQQKKFPILDWPVDKLDIMQKNYANVIFKVYIQTEDIPELKRRLSLDDRDKDGKRYEAGIKELDDFLAGKFDNLIDLKLINKKNKDKETAQIIYDFFIKTIES